MCELSDRLPDFLIVGAAKSGTTSLYHYLNEHPDIFMSPDKEPGFFVYANKELPQNQWEKTGCNDFKKYKSLFANSHETQMVGEASNLYLYLNSTAINNIKINMSNWQDLKIIIILRNPIERAFSMFSMLKLKNAEALTFEEALKLGKERVEKGDGYGYDYVGFGLYYNQVKAYLDMFPYVEIFLFEDLVESPLSVIKDLYTFIHVDNSFVPKNLSKKYNPSGIPRNKTVDGLLNNIKNFLVQCNWQIMVKPFVRLMIRDKNKRLQMFNKSVAFVDGLKDKNLKKESIKIETRQYLMNIYKDDILKLQKLIKRDLSHWLQ